MNIIYDLTAYLAQFFVWLSRPFSIKLKKFYNGRRGLFERMEREVDRGRRHAWFHFASLGEFEQGRTVLEAFTKRFPDQAIVVTFFSPSGFEIRKNYAQAKHVYYLPVDTASNARRFISIINPSVAFFVKYEFWRNYYAELSQKKVPIYLVSAIFRKDQPFFKWYGGLFRKTLSFVDYFFVQNQESGRLLAEVGISDYELTGDTRFDRVIHLPEVSRNIEVIKAFAGDSKILVAGSTYMPDEELLMSLKQIYPEWKFIIAPHVISKAHTKEIGDRFSNSVLYSVLNAYVRPTEKLSGLAYDPSHGAELSSLDERNKLHTVERLMGGDSFEEQLEEKKPDVLIIDNIGMLAYLYAYGDLCYIGGGFGGGIHNTLEAATYGLPIMMGPNFGRFQEAKDLFKMQAAFCVQNLNELVTCFEKLQDDQVRSESGKRARAYVEQQAGATVKILEHVAARAPFNV